MVTIRAGRLLRRCPALVWKIGATRTAMIAPARRLVSGLDYPVGQSELDGSMLNERRVRRDNQAGIEQNSSGGRLYHRRQHPSHPSHRRPRRQGPPWLTSTAVLVATSRQNRWAGRRQNQMALDTVNPRSGVPDLQAPGLRALDDQDSRLRRALLAARLRWPPDARSVCVALQHEAWAPPRTPNRRMNTGFVEGRLPNVSPPV